ncbi:Ig-like domain-containing protein [Halobacteriaceae archaeon GCM10025711]
MTLRDDGRGQSVQVGAIMLFAVLVVALSYVQAAAVPQENKAVEFNDYETASADVTDLRNAVLTAAGGDTTRAVTVKTGSRYPPRLLFVNPPPASGALVTGDPATVTLSNVTATATEPGTVQAYWNGSPRTYATRRVAFQPAYNVLNAGPVVVEHGTVFRDFGPNRTVPLTDQPVVVGNRISLVTVAGDVAQGGDSASVTAVPVSAHVRTVSVTGENGTPVTLTLPTDRTVADWRTALADERDPDGTRSDRYVTAVRAGPTPGTVTVTFEGDATYELRLASVALRSESDRSRVSRPSPQYVVPVGDATVDLRNGSATPLTVEVRDAFNNPVSDATVTFDASAGSFASTGDSSVNVTTGAEGRATATFRSTTSATVNASIGAGPAKSTTFDVDVDAGGGVGGELNPGGTGSVVLADETAGSGGEKNQVVMTFDNTASSEKNVTAARVNFYYTTSKKGPPSTMTFEDPAGYPSLTVGGSFETFADDPIVLPANQETDVTVAFSGGNKQVAKGDFFVLTLVFDDGESATYFVVP